MTTLSSAARKMAMASVAKGVTRPQITARRENMKKARKLRWVKSKKSQGKGAPVE